MEVGGGRGRRGTGGGETSPPVRARLSYSQQQEQQRLMRPQRKVQVIYYLSRNGQLEHPHFIELPHLPSQQLRLRDVVERLTLLRGKGMPSLFSWSCKRSYKNGYVWNDLAENDVVYPVDGVEYVLKGSEIIPGAYERFRHVPANCRQPKPLPIAHKLHLELEEDEEEEDDQVEDEATEEGEARRGKRTAVGTGYTRCSRGVSTDEMERVEHRTTPTELPLDDSSPPSSTSSDKPPTHAAGGASRRSEDTDQAAEPGQTRNSVLLQLIACGSAALTGRSCPSSGTSKATASASSSAPCGGSGSGRRRGMVSRLASRGSRTTSCGASRRTPGCVTRWWRTRSTSVGASSKEAELQPSLLSRNPPPSTKKDRSSRLGIGEGKLDVEESRGGGVKGKCIPGRRRSSGRQQ